MKYFYALLIMTILSNCKITYPTGKITISKFPAIEISEQVRFSQKADRLSLENTISGKTLIAFRTDVSFLTAARAEEKVKYRMAAFKMHERLRASCGEQTIEKVQYQGNTLSISGNLRGTLCLTAYTIKIMRKNDGKYTIQAELADKSLNRIYLRTLAYPTEAIFGMGEQFTYLNQKGHKIPVLTEEQGIGRGAQPITAGANLMAGAGGNSYTSYAPIPFYMSTENYSVAMDNSSYSVFDFTSSGETKITLWENNISLTLTHALSLKELLADYTASSGRMRPLPDWVHGTILGVQGGKDKVEKVLKEAQDAGNPVTAIWIQDWVGRRLTSFGSQLWWRWTPDEKSYPDFRNWTASLQKRGIKTLGYINPFLADEGPMYQEAVKGGYLVKNATGNVYSVQTAGFPAVMIDLTNPSAVKWIKGIIKKNLIGNGISGYMADFGEWLPFDAKLFSGISAGEYHNVYPVDWARVNREAIQEAGLEGKVAFFTRAGFTKSSKYSTLFWAGDQMVSFDEHDGLASSITGILTGGLSGISLNHSDIGGYTTINNPLKNYHRSKELFYRWTEANAFSPVYRTHEGNRPEKNHQFYTDADSQKFFARFGKIHRALSGYLANVEKESSLTGLPVMRALALEYPEDKETHSLRHQYLLGPDLLVMPVVKNKQKYICGYLPKGNWRHIFTAQIMKGPSQICALAETGKPAVFLREAADTKLLEPLIKAIHEK